MMHKSLFLVFSFIFVAYVVRAQEEIPLEKIIALALERNYDVKLARNTADIAVTNDQYAFGAFIPQITGTASTVWNSNQQKVVFSDVTKNNSGEAKANNTAASLQLVWTLFDGTRMFATRERIAVLREQGELLVKDQMVNTIAAVVNNYYNVIQQKQQLKAIQEQMSVSEERVKLAERKLQVGTGAKPELLQAKVDYNAQRAQAIQQESAIRQLKQQLNGLVGLQLPAEYDVADSIVINLDLNLEEIASNIENSNYSLLAAKRNYNIASLSLHERRAELFPFLNFNAAYNYSRTDNTKLINPFNALFSRSIGFNYGFSVNIPLITAFNTRRNIQQAKINVDRQQVLYNQLNTNVNVGLQNAWVNYDNAKKILLVEEENILVAKENVSIALETFKRGASTFVELRTAQQSLADAYTRLIQARYLAKVAEVELLRLNGDLLK
jgi:outer membrane protein TolC